MLRIVNDELMTYNIFESKDNVNGKQYTKIRLISSNKVVQPEGNLRRYNRDQVETPRASKNTPVVSKIEHHVPVNREILRISAPLKTLSDNMEGYSVKDIEFDTPMSINVMQKHQPQVEIRCHKDGEDRANVYVIAFPFNGMIRPIAENPQYRIYKGLIATSSKPFFFNGCKYKKILYLVIEVNKNLFQAEHKYHTDHIDIDLESFAIFEDRDTGDKKTNCEKMHLSITSAAGDYTVSWESNVVNEPILMNVEPGTPLWTTFTFPQKKELDKNAPRDTKKQFNRKGGNRQKPSHVEGNMVVTTNRHGIRKEIPMKQQNDRKSQYRDSYKRSYNDYDDIDTMMKSSGMYDHDDRRGGRSKKNGGKNRRR